MPNLTRLYNFQPGTPISSSQMNQELNQLVNGVNNTYSKTESDANFLKKTALATATPLMQSGWVSRSGSESAYKFIRTQEGLVHVVGSIINGATGINSVISNIPPGFEPAKIEYMVVGSGLVRFQGSQVSVARSLPTAEVFFNMTYSTV
ncbi:hypothetical protein [Ectobacillus antri]|uniref:hypothetical protein n=1 Tax=Ectobacillus antri TaxID=2486280 RepID=UPI000F5A0C9A|nr:hypothetical protein [Ectobacillus antri]